VPAELWPPDHKLVRVSILGVADPDGDPVAVAITRVTQDEPPSSRDDRAVCVTPAGVGTAIVSLPAERSGTGDGRVYHVTFTADDGRGQPCTGTVTVCVPHDQRPGHVCGDQGAVADATGPSCIVSCEANALFPCQDDRVPIALDHWVKKARELLRLGAGQPAGPRNRRLVTKLRKAVRKAGRVAARAEKQRPISGSCLQELAHMFLTAEACADRWLERAVAERSEVAAASWTKGTPKQATLRLRSRAAGRAPASR